MNNRIKDIYMQYYSMVIGIAYNTLHNMDASSDVAAEVFLKLVENMKLLIKIMIEFLMQEYF